MKKAIFASLLAVAVSPAWADNGASSSAYVVAGTALDGTAGISMPGTNPPTTDPLDQSMVVSFENAPLMQTENVLGGADGSGFIVYGQRLMSETWRKTLANGTKVYAYRQINDPFPGYPHFGGEVVAKVDSTVNVYFGEWAPRGNNNGQAHNPDLGMNSSLRTVYYVGENPTSSMPNLTNVAYDVVGIQKYNPDTQAGVYTGTLTANFSGTSGSITGTLNGVNFSGTSISSDGSFSNSSTITGKFYGNSAEALAGMYDTTGVANDMAFGGAQQ